MGARLKFWRWSRVPKKENRDEAVVFLRDCLSLVCILMKQRGVHGGKYLLKTLRSGIFWTLNLKCP